MTAQEAMVLAIEWANGTRSHVSEFVFVEGDEQSRQVTMALCTFADAQEAGKWAAIAIALSRIDAGGVRLSRCVCGALWSVNHAATCSRGGVAQR